MPGAAPAAGRRAAGRASMRRCCASGACMKPGQPVSTEAQGRPLRIQAAHQQRGQLLEQLDVLLGHGRAHHLLHHRGRGARARPGAAAPRVRRRAQRVFMRGAGIGGAMPTKPRQRLDALQPGAQVRVGLQRHAAFGRVRGVGVERDVGDGGLLTGEVGLGGELLVHALEELAGDLAAARVVRPAEQHVDARSARAVEPAGRRPPRASAARARRPAGRAAATGRSVS